MISQLTSKITTAISLIIVARFLGSTNYGQVSIAMIPASIATLFLNPGVNGALVKYLAQYRSEKKAKEAKSILITGLTIKIIIGSTLTIITYALSGYLASQIFNQPEIKLLIQVTSLNLIAISLITTAKSIFIGYERMELVSIIVIIQSLLKSFLAPILVYIGYGTLGSVSGYTASLIMAGLVGLILVRKYFIKQDTDDEPEIDYYGTSLIILTYGAPLFLSILLSGSILQIYNLLLAIHVNPYEIGNYQAALNFTILITFFSMPIGTVLFPLFSKISPGDNKTLEAVYKNAVKYSALIIVPLALSIILLSNPLANIIYGRTYSQTPYYLKWICIPFMFAGIGANVNDNLLNGQGKTRTIFMSHLVTFLVGLPVSLYLIPRIGVTGLLIATIIAPLAGQLNQILWIKRDFAFFFDWKTSVKIYLSSAIAFISSFLFMSSTALPEWIQLILGGIIFTIIYLIIIIFLKTLTTEDLQNLRRILSSMGPLTPIFNCFLSILEKIIT